MSDFPSSLQTELSNGQLTPTVQLTLSVAKQSVRVPAYGLIVLSIVAVLIDLAILQHAWFDDWDKINAYSQPGTGLIVNIAGIAANTILLFVHLFIIFGSIQMLRLNAFSTARLAAVVSVIPFCSPIVVIGIPFGVWALIIMSDSLVRDAFDLNEIHRLALEQADIVLPTGTGERIVEECPYCDNIAIPDVDGRCTKCRRPIS